MKPTTSILALAAFAGISAGVAQAAPVISRLTPPSALFTFADPTPPYVARFLPGQRFDLDATVQPDVGQTITKVEFKVNGASMGLSSAPRPANAVTVPPLAANSVCVAKRAISMSRPGVYTFTCTVTQSDNAVTTASGNFEIVNINQRAPGQTGALVKAKNVIILIGDGMGIAHRTAARIMAKGVQQGKALDTLAMDKLPNVALIGTHSLNSIITDSSPGAACYSTGNKGNNNQHGVFPDDTTDNFDNPRIENMGEYLYRTQGKVLGIVTTSDVFDATPASFATHTQNRGAGTGICDQYYDERNNTGLRVLLGGGRKWFLPSTTTGSARGNSTDYAGSDVQGTWNVPGGILDATRDLLADFQSPTKGNFFYAPDKTTLFNMPPGTQRLLGLFSMSNMNVAKDKIDGRRAASTVVSDYGLPDQPMLDEMADKALQVLSQNKTGFTLMIEAASIDKQAHNMDSERWMLDTLEFDRAIERCRQFALKNPDTLVLVTADHECAGVNIIGASTVTNADLITRSTSGLGTASGGPRANGVVGIYEAARFPQYTIAADGYPVTTDPDYKMLIGYAGNADRYEDWLTNGKPLIDTQQPSALQTSLGTLGYPAGPLNRDVAGGFLVTGQVEGSSAVHTGSDIPLSAGGRGANLFNGFMDNTDVFFKAMQAVLVGAPK